MAVGRQNRWPILSPFGNHSIKPIGLLGLWFLFSSLPFCSALCTGFVAAWPRLWKWSAFASRNRKHSERKLLVTFTMRWAINSHASSIMWACWSWLPTATHTKPMASRMDWANCSTKLRHQPKLIHRNAGFLRSHRSFERWTFKPFHPLARFWR